VDKLEQAVAALDHDRLDPEEAFAAVQTSRNMTG
jgi:hypothetical protein